MPFVVRLTSLAVALFACAAIACTSSSDHACTDAGHVDDDYTALPLEAGVACIDQCRLILGDGVQLDGCRGPSSLPSGRIVVHCIGSFSACR